MSAVIETKSRGQLSTGVITSLVALCSALSLLQACSLFVTDVTECQTTAECREQFGLGFVCADDGLCEEAARPRRCDSTFPADLFSNEDLRKNAIVFGTLFDRSQVAHVARQQSAQLAVRQVNDRDGLARRKFGLVFCTIEPNPSYDPCPAGSQPSACRKEAAVESAEYLADVLLLPAIIGPSASDDTLAVSNRLQELQPRRTLVMSPASTSVDLTAKDPIDVTNESPGMLWRTAPPDSEQARAIAEDMTVPGAERGEEKVKDVTVIFADGSYGSSLANAFVRNFEALDPSARATLKPFTQVDQIVTLATEASDSAVDEVLFIAQASEVVRFLTAVDTNWQGASAGRGFSEKGIFLTDTGASTDVLTKSPARAFMNLRGSRPAPANEQRNIVFRNFKAQYAAEYNQEDISKLSYTANTYDATWLLMYGSAWAQFRHGGAITGENIARGLRRVSSGQRIEIDPGSWDRVLQQFSAGASIDVFGASGSLDYDPKTEETTSDVEIWQVPVDGIRPEDRVVVQVDTWSPPEKQ